MVIENKRKIAEIYEFLTNSDNTDYIDTHITPKENDTLRGSCIFSDKVANRCKFFDANKIHAYASNFWSEEYGGGGQLSTELKISDDNAPSPYNNTHYRLFSMSNFNLKLDLRFKIKLATGIDGQIAITKLEDNSIITNNDAINGVLAEDYQIQELPNESYKSAYLSGGAKLKFVQIDNQLHLRPCKLILDIPAKYSIDNQEHKAGEIGMWDNFTYKFFPSQKGSYNVSGELVETISVWAENLYFGDKNIYGAFVNKVSGKSVVTRTIINRPRIVDNLKGIFLRRHALKTNFVVNEFEILFRGNKLGHSISNGYGTFFSNELMVFTLRVDAYTKQSTFKYNNVTFAINEFWSNDYWYYKFSFINGIFLVECFDKDFILKKTIKKTFTIVEDYDDTKGDAVGSDLGYSTDYGKTEFTGVSLMSLKISGRNNKMHIVPCEKYNGKYAFYNLISEKLMDFTVGLDSIGVRIYDDDNKNIYTIYGNRVRRNNPSITT